MLRLAAALLTFSALVLAFAPGPTPPVEVTTLDGHTLTIEYLESRGLYRRAKVSVQSERGARAPWQGRLRQVHVEGLQPLSSRDREAFAREGVRQTAAFSASGPAAGTTLLAPEPRNLKRIWFRGERGSDVSLRIPTRTHNPSTEEGDDDTGEDPKPEDPDPGDDTGGDDGDDDDDDDDQDEGCWGAADCHGIYNPWTCVCTERVEDRWTGSPSTRGASTRISF